MSDRYHINENGPALCTAKPGNCPLGGAHGTQEEMEETFAQQQGGSSPQTLKKKSTGRAFIDSKFEYTQNTDSYEINAAPFEYLDVPAESWQVESERLSSEYRNNKNKYEALKKQRRQFFDTFGSQYEHEKKIASRDGIAGERARERLKEIEKIRKQYSENTLQATYEDANSKLEPARIHLNTTFAKMRYAKKAARLSQHRTVHGAEVKPGEGVFQAIYSPDGKLLGLDKSSRVSGASLKLPNGDTFKYRLSQSQDPEKRHAQNLKKGFRVGTAIAPASIDKSQKIASPRTNSKNAALIRPTKNTGIDPLATPTHRDDNDSGFRE